MTTKDDLHRLFDELPDSETAAAHYLAYLRDCAAAGDPLSRVLAAAPADEARRGDEDPTARQEAWEDYRACRTITLEEMRRELDLAQEPDPEEGQ